MAWLDIAGTDIHFLEFGTGQPLLFLHGNGSSGLNWHQQIDFFKDRYWVIAYDSINHGHSGNSPRNEREPDRVDELERVLEALGIERPILCGHSMGGSTVVRWACRHPSSALALVVSGSGVARSGSGAPRAAEPLPESAAFLPPSAGTFTEDWVHGHGRELARYAQLRSSGTRLEAQRHPRQATTARPSRDPTELVPLVKAIKSPLLAIVGRLDAALPSAEHLHELVPGSRLEVLEGNAHNEYYQSADEFNRRVAAFLDGALSEATGVGRSGLVATTTANSATVSQRVISDQ
jgi:pimeloyl-ACP methyl ester carboxylesterase